MRVARVKIGEEELLSHCEVTESALERMRGLLPKAGLGAGEGLYIAPCTSVHTFFMRFPIDAAFLDRSGRVLRVYRNLRPWRLSFVHLRAAGVLETRAGELARLRKGEQLVLCPTT